MGIYNCQNTLREALNSIVNQTYPNWEIVMCDDGSSDETFQVASEYRDKYPQKIFLLKNERNCGLNHSLNRCLSKATGAFIARMDGDDRCALDRLEKEMAVLLRHPELSIVSSDMQYFSENKVWGRITHPEFPVNADFVHESPFCHAPCLVRKEAFDAVGGYSEDKLSLRVEDYDLWIKMYAKGFKGRNIHEPLYQMRDDQKAYKRRKFKYRINEAHVKLLAVKKLNLPMWMSVYCLRPIITGLLPPFMYDWLHKKRLAKMN